PPAASVPGFASRSRLSGASSSVMTSSPRLVDASFQWCRVYWPAPNKAVVIPAASRNGKYGRLSNVFHRLSTRAIEQPTINSPPATSPQRMFFSSMNAVSTPARWPGGAAATGGVGSATGGSGAAGGVSTGTAAGGGG